MKPTDPPDRTGSGLLRTGRAASCHSHDLVKALGRRIDRATDVTGLSAPAREVETVIRSLHADGLKATAIAAVVGSLNRQIFARLWEMLAPEALRADSCLLVMGSEGRGEQIVRTDQDNALILRDGRLFPGLDAVTSTFSAALADFGYPPCPGGIMLSRPSWCRSEAGFRSALFDWTQTAAPDGPMNLAIFLDARVVAGDAGLLEMLDTSLRPMVAGNDAFFARFAAAIGQFGREGGWWRRLPGLRGRGAAEIDLKKLGLFPVVHGVRTLALEAGVRAVSTDARLSELEATGRIDHDLARDLRGALGHLMGLKLSENLRQMAMGRRPDNLVRIGDLDEDDRRTLREALSTARRFKAWLAWHYRLDTL